MEGRPAEGDSWTRRDEAKAEINQEAGRFGGPSASFSVGEEVEYNSVTNKQWMLMRVVSQNGDGTYELDGRARADEKRIRRPVGPIMDHAAVQRAFSAFDADNSGTLTVDELLAILCHPKGGHPFSTHEARRLVDMFDAN